MPTFFTGNAYPYSSTWVDAKGRAATPDAKTPGVLTADVDGALTSVPTAGGLSGEVTFNQTGEFVVTLAVDADMSDGVRSITATATATVVDEGPGEVASGELVLTGNAA